MPQAVGLFSRHGSQIRGNRLGQTCQPLWISASSSEGLCLRFHASCLPTLKKVIINGMHNLMARNEEQKKKQIIWFHPFHSTLFKKYLLSTYCVHDKYLCLSLFRLAKNYSVKFSDSPGVYLLSVSPFLMSPLWLYYYYRIVCYLILFFKIPKKKAKEKTFISK